MSKKALLFINKKKPPALLLAEEIRSILEKHRYTIDIFSDIEKTNNNPTEVDLSISLGGDGTVLYAARTMAPLETPLLPVNLGSLGFIAAILPSQWEEVYNKWENGQAILSRRLMLDVSVERKGSLVFRGCCLNDAVISCAGIAKLVRLEVEALTACGDTISLGPFRADGLIVATPTGSTAYSVAAGGPIIDPEMDLVIINPICPFTLANRPVVVPSDEKIIVLVEHEQRSPVILTMDGQITEQLESGDKINICRYPKTLSLIASDRCTFYQALRTKLSWSGGTHA